MASADIATMNGAVGSQRHYGDDINTALYTKREEIEEEIRNFRAQKETEYKQYEEQLRQRRGANRGAGEKGADAPAPHTEQSGQERPRPRVQRRISNEERRSNRPPRTARQALNQAFSMSSEEARDFEGVFTPEYLGLIDVKDKKHGKSSGFTHDRSDQKTQLSSSVTLHPPLIFPWSSSPTQSFKVSSSAPEHHSPVKTHHRSDSANSTLSVQSLRSSMKDPKTPKSPKRVLFSIEDGVVSPSTSPSLNRKDRAASAGEGNAPESLLSFAKRTSREKKKKNRRKERGDGDRGRRRDDPEGLEGLGLTENRGFSPLEQEVSTTALPSLQVPDAHTNETTTAGKPSPSDEFEPVISPDGDDMFAFDEDLTARSAPKSPEIKDELELEEEADVTSSKALDELGTSPHAGSLPIEIKWPERRASGGSG